MHKTAWNQEKVYFSGAGIPFSHGQKCSFVEDEWQLVLDSRTSRISNLNAHTNTHAHFPKWVTSGLVISWQIVAIWKGWICLGSRSQHKLPGNSFPVDHYTFSFTRKQYEEMILHFGNIAAIMYYCCKVVLCIHFWEQIFSCSDTWAGSQLQTPDSWSLAISLGLAWVRSITYTSWPGHGLRGTVCQQRSSGAGYQFSYSRKI